MKVFPLLFFLSIPFIVTAQFSKGTMYLGGSLSAQAEGASPQQPTSTVISVSPQFGYFLTSKWAIGAGLQFTYDKNSSHDLAKQYSVEKTYNFAPFVRYYIPITKHFLIAFQAQYWIGGENAFNYTLVYPYTTGVGSSFTEKYLEMGMSIKPFLVFFPSPKFSIEGGISSLAWQYWRLTQGERQYNSNFSLTAGQFTLGANWYFNRKVEE